ncbi:hypothetical protein prwr041_23220 [Prevotella herbatica]|uniref:Uncharacterized protein n=2 Tax=Prevotella herbatica TaxID=2801997 RepID=A0ABM7P0X3_9BACT|nr:hypothetical protein prwr041_23220 [Prevotella herbatica]
MDKNLMNKITEQLQAYINEQEKMGGTPNEEILNRFLGDIITFQNETPIANFKRFTPDQMYQMLNDPLGKKCPVKLRKLSDSEIEEIPFIKQALYLLRSLSEKELKLTPQGYIPPKLVTELYDMGLSDWSSDYYKQKLESRVEVVQVLRIALKECGFIKVRCGKMSLTTKGGKMLKDYNALLHALMIFLLLDFNAGYFDLYNDIEIGNVGRLYSLWLLHRYGDTWRHKKFYAEAYFKAFPGLSPSACYELRTFDRVFHYIGLCDINKTEKDRGIDFGSKTRKREILDKIFTFIEPQNK